MSRHLDTRLLFVKFYMNQHDIVLSPQYNECSVIGKTRFKPKKRFYFRFPQTDNSESDHDSIYFVHLLQRLQKHIYVDMCPFGV